MTLRSLWPRSIWNGLFGSWYNAILTLLMLWMLIAWVPPIIDWAIFSSKIAPDPAACRATFGACWGFILEKHRLILFGGYPYEQQWRPLIASILFIVLLVTSCNRRFWQPALAAGWLLGLIVIFVLMRGGLLGLSVVESARWGGLPLTLILAVVGLVIAFPIAVILALGRRSQLPVIRAICITFIELVRGVPLISLLFMASVMVPLFLPEGLTVDKLIRAEIGIIIFAAAYSAESVRGGLQSLNRGQEEAADALGLSYFDKMRRIVLPQALRIAIPSITNNFISTFKDTSLVVVIGMFDLLGALKAGLNDAQWRTFYIEGYLFVAAIYFVFCISISKYAQYLESDIARTTAKVD
jgi:general L-amino acid transport system permease protein